MLDVLGRHRVVVVETRVCANLKNHRSPIGGYKDVLCQQTISGGGLVHRSHQQRFEYELPQARSRCAFEGERVELVKARDPRWWHQHQLATSRRLRVDIVKEFEVRRVFDISKLRVGMRRPARRKPHKSQKNNETTHATILQDFFGVNPWVQKLAFYLEKNC